MRIQIDHATGELGCHIDDAIAAVRVAAAADMQKASKTAGDDVVAGMLRHVDEVVARRGQAVFDAVVGIGETAEARRG